MIEKPPKSRVQGQQRVKGHFSGHETFPLRQLWLSKAYIYGAQQHNESLVNNSQKIKPNIFKDESAIARFGVGINMVKSIRHWALATDVLTEVDGSDLTGGALGEALGGRWPDCKDPLDPYFERPDSIWLVHWMLAGRGERSTTFKWLFSHVNEATFDRARLMRLLQEWCVGNGYAPNDTSLKKDLDTVLRCYLPRASAGSKEEAAEPLLSELGMLLTDASGGFTFHRGEKPSLSAGAFLYCVLDFWLLRHYKSQAKTLSLDLILNDRYSPGRVFKLKEDDVVARLFKAEEMSKIKSGEKDKEAWFEYRESDVTPQLYFFGQSEETFRQVQGRILRGIYERGQ